MRRTVFVLIRLIAIYVEALTLDETHRMVEEHYPLISDYGMIQLTEHYNVENASKAWLPQILLYH